MKVETCMYHPALMLYLKLLTALAVLNVGVNSLSLLLSNWGG